jgi:hypothetical protein
MLSLAIVKDIEKATAGYCQGYRGYKRGYLDNYYIFILPL